MSSKGLEFYLQLPYKVEIFPDEEGEGYTAIVPELPGCMSATDDFAELESLIHDAKRVWLEVALKHGDHIPEPMPEEVKDYSGKFLVRVPKSLHRQLSIRAEIDGTSLNQLVVAVLADSMGRWSASENQVPPIQAKDWVIDRKLAVMVPRSLAVSSTKASEGDRLCWNTNNFNIPTRQTKVTPI
jgi:antitoxin HicB